MKNLIQNFQCVAEVHKGGDLCRETEISLHNVEALQGCVVKSYDNSMPNGINQFVISRVRK